MGRLVIVSILALALAGAGRGGEEAGLEELDETYGSVARRLIDAAMSDEEGWAKLGHLTTRIGARLSGSQALDEAVHWASDGMASDGLDNVRRQPVTVSHWVRGEASAEVVGARPRRLRILALGGSVATPEEGLEAPVVVVRGFDELEALGRRAVEGRIVVYAVPWRGYGATVAYRYGGASRAAALGAVAALVRSATGRSLYTPHTGAMRYTEGVPRIPAAALTVEDSEWLRRATAGGEEVRLRLMLSSQQLPDAESANVIGEIRGSKLPQEVVVMGGHLDSWDVGQGAHDDGAACVAAWQALALVRRLGLTPRRTLRVVLWTNEENGLAGGRAYRDSIGTDLTTHVAAIEMDGGVERPVGFGFSLGARASDSEPRQERAMAILRQIGALLEPVGGGEIRAGGRDADIGPLIDGGVPGLGLRTVMEHYFDWHHTDADTLDKVEPENLRRATAMLAVMGYVLADMPARLDP